MITDNDIKQIVAPKLKAIIDAGISVLYCGEFIVISANVDDGIRIGFDSDLYGWSESNITTESMLVWNKTLPTLPEFLQRFTTKTSIQKMEEIFNDLDVNSLYWHRINIDKTGPGEPH